MMLINVNKIFENAIYDKDVEKLEKILSSSDNEIDLIENFSKSNDLEVFREILPKFRSKGLVQNLEDFCDIISSRNSKDKIDRKFITSKVVLVHYKNKEENKEKHLTETTFKKQTFIYDI